MDQEPLQALIERSKNNDKQAFALLVREYQTFCANCKNIATGLHE
jgi:hypothetical protein